MKPWNPNENDALSFSPTFAIAGHSVALLLARWPGMQGIQGMTQPTNPTNNQPTNQPNNQTKKITTQAIRQSQLPGSKLFLKKKSNRKPQFPTAEPQHQLVLRSMSVMLNFQSLQAPGLARLLWVAWTRLGPRGRGPNGRSVLQKPPGKLEKLTFWIKKERRFEVFGSDSSWFSEFQLYIADECCWSYPPWNWHSPWK